MRDKRSARVLVLLLVGWGVAGADIDVDVDAEAEAVCCEIAREMNHSWRRRRVGVGWIG